MTGTMGTITSTTKQDSSVAEGTSCPPTPSDTSEWFDSLSSMDADQSDQDEMMRALAIVGDRMVQANQENPSPLVLEESPTDETSLHPGQLSEATRAEANKKLRRLQTLHNIVHAELDHPTKEQISRELTSKEYPVLARQLKFSSADINHIEYECRQRGQGLREINYQIIEQWEQRMGDRATFKALVSALRAVGREDIADSLHPDGVLKEILASIQLWQLEVYQRDLQLPQLQWTDKILPLEELYVDLEMFETNKHGNEKEGRDMNIKEIFDPIDDLIDPKRILIEGAPGYGKTTLMLKFLSDWVRDEEYMQRFELVFAFSLRYFNEYASVREALMVCLEETGVEPALGLECIERFQDKILLLLDGYDELNEKSKEELTNLLKKKEFPRLYVVLTSRRGWFQLREKEEVKTKARLQLGVTYSYFWNKRVVIKGIAEENIEEFLKKYFRDSSSQIEKAIRIFQKANKELFQCPLFLMLLAVIVEDEISEEIKTKTSLYRFFFNTVFRRGLIREEMIPSNGQVDIFSATAHEPFYIKDFVNFGKIALHHLTNDDYSITENEILEQTNYNGYFLKIGIVTKNLVFPANRNRFSEVFQPIHKTFLEFSAAFYLHHVNLGLIPGCDFQSEIASLVDKGFGCNSDSLVYSFLGGLMNSTASQFFDIITPWNALFPIKSERMLSILDEIEEGESLLNSLVPFIPSVVKLEVFEFKENSFMRKMIGKLVQAGCKENLIRVLELNPELYSKMSELTGSLYVDLLVFKIEQGELVEPVQTLNRCQLKCNKLVCTRYLDDLPESDFETVAGIISSIDAKKISFEFYSFSFDHMMVEAFHEILTKGQLRNDNIHRLAIPSVENEVPTLPLWMDIVEKERIGKSVLLSVSLVNPHELQQLLDRIANAQHVVHFGICKGFYSSAEKIVVNFNHFCVGSQKRWQRLDFERVTLDGLEVNEKECSVAEITLKNTGHDNLKILQRCADVEYLRCSAETFRALIDTDWPQLRSLIELNLFDLDVLPNLLLLTNLQVLSLDMEEISLETDLLIQLILHTNLNTLILLNNGDDLFLTPLLRSWLEALAEMQKAGDDDATTQHALLPNASGGEEASKKSKSTLDSLAIEIECYDFLPNDKFRSCFPLLRELLRNKHLRKVSMFMFDENLKLSPSSFPVNEHFTITREVNGINAEEYAKRQSRQCSYFSSYISSYRRIRSNTFEGLAITHEDS